MKKIRNWIILMLAVCVMAITMAACSVRSVKFDLNFIVDGSVYATINTEGQETLQLPQDPTKEDYVFDGWYWDKDVWSRPFTANSLLNEKLTSNMSVYAKWIEEDII